MSFNFRFDRDKGIMYVKALGGIDLIANAGVLNRLVSDYRLDNGLGIIFDAREIFYVPSREEVDVLSRSQAWRQMLERHSVAIVVSKPIQYGVANILARKTESGGGRVERFYDLDNAKAWLEEMALERPKALAAGS